MTAAMVAVAVGGTVLWAGFAPVMGEVRAAMLVLLAEVPVASALAVLHSLVWSLIVAVGLSGLLLAGLWMPVWIDRPRAGLSR
jgi:hypothetical protein